MDCEMVGVGDNGTRSILARCSIVNFRGEVLYDKFIKPMEKVTDYRTHVSGIRPKDINGPHAITLRQCQTEVAELLDRRILVGHAVDNDLSCLLLSHPKHLTRDTAYYKPLCPKRPKSLKKLSQVVLNKTIQTGEHSSVEDAQCTLEIYKVVMDEWEKSMSHGPRFNRKSSSKKSEVTKKTVTVESKRKKIDVKQKVLNSKKGGEIEGIKEDKEDESKQNKTVKKKKKTKNKGKKRRRTK
eukprot:CAMPEP_0114500464 /NCGR_PEP_ID=MMETSP0109-20121206/7978_1 /TAXON_ID=29199 /ORGANISM="Chlorarachnion reptans, Strain CCCM449" /LENGTH=239 /DNA_ID=CAMNT_0001678127 /DNA_START=90 /DNA_END=809 /DNA_ORIENTATION=+